jgi:hypothetical protein
MRLPSWAAWPGTPIDFVVNTNVEQSRRAKASMGSMLLAVKTILEEAGT